MFWGIFVGAERDATRTSKMRLRTIRTLTDELRMKYGRATDTKVRKDFMEKLNDLGMLSDP